MLPKGLKMAWSPPYQRGVAVPARQAYSHWASVGSQNRAPVWRESQAQKAKALFQETRTTGWSGPLTG